MRITKIGHGGEIDLVSGEETGGAYMTVEHAERSVDVPIDEDVVAVLIGILRAEAETDPEKAEVALAPRVQPALTMPAPRTLGLYGDDESI